MSEALGHDLDRHALADQVGGMAMTEHVEVELDPGASPQPRDEAGHGLVAQRVAMRLAPEVDEDVVAVDVPVLGEKILRVQPDQRAVTGMQ